MYAVIVMEAGMHHAQYVMEIEEEMDICQMEKSAICAKEKRWFRVLYVTVQEKLKTRKFSTITLKVKKQVIWMNSLLFQNRGSLHYKILVDLSCYNSL